MKSIICIMVLLTAFSTMAICSENPITFDRAKAKAANTGLPILLEFVHQD